MDAFGFATIVASPAIHVRSPAGRLLHRRGKPAAEHAGASLLATGPKRPAWHETHGTRRPPTPARQAGCRTCRSEPARDRAKTTRVARSPRDKASSYTGAASRLQNMQERACSRPGQNHPRGTKPTGQGVLLHRRGKPAAEHAGASLLATGPKRPTRHETHGTRHPAKGRRSGHPWPGSLRKSQALGVCEKPVLKIFPVAGPVHARPWSRKVQPSSCVERAQRAESQDLHHGAPAN